VSRTQCPDRTRNGTHSLLAYAGLQAGHTFVHEAIAEPHLHELAHSLMLDEAAPTIEAPGGMDLTGYT